MLIEFVDAKRSISGSHNRNVPLQKVDGGEGLCRKKV